MKKIILTLLLLFSSFAMGIEQETIRNPIVIMESNQIIDGKMKIIKVDDLQEIPAFIIGDPNEAEPVFRIKNVTLKNFIIDGNKDMQRNEFWRKGISNSGIVVRNGENIIITNCFVARCRSAGIVIEKNSKNVFIQQSTFTNNYFDGIAGYSSSNIYVTNCLTTKNKAAGLSFDWHVTNLEINQTMSIENDIGIFVRNCSNILLKESFFSNKRYDYYFNQVDNDPLTKPFDIKFKECITQKENVLNVTK